MIPDNLKPGDPVRVTVEGRAGDLDRWLINAVHASIRADLPGVVAVEITPPVKVGDTVEGEDAYEALPVGTVVTSPGYLDIDVNLRTNAGWVDQAGNKYGPRGLYSPRVVVHLPA